MTYVRYVSVGRRFLAVLIDSILVGVATVPDDVPRSGVVPTVLASASSTMPEAAGR